MCLKNKELLEKQKIGLDTRATLTHHKLYKITIIEKRLIFQQLLFIYPRTSYPL